MCRNDVNAINSLIFNSIILITLINLEIVNQNCNIYQKRFPWP